jgi:type I restriction enzyme M protein
VILPHGVLFRGGAEATSASASSAGLYQGHHRPARQPVLRHRHPGLHHRARQGRAAGRKGIFMIDASKGFIKDGNKNRLRAQDIHKIVTSSTASASCRATRAWCRWPRSRPTTST